jgi:hypothetical protein
VNSTQGQTFGLWVGVTALRVVLEVRSIDLCTGARVVLGDVLGRGYRKQIGTPRCRIAVGLSVDRRWVSVLGGSDKVKETCRWEAA